MKKILIFDASTIITLTMNGLSYILRELKSINGKFIITNQVKKEIIDRPLTIRRFKLGALKIKKLFDDKILQPPEEVGISSDEVNKRARELLNQINKIYMADDEYIHIMHEGEASCLALSLLASQKNIKNLISIDERTTRILVEKPDNLKKLLKRKLHKSVHIKNKIPDLSKIKIIRSSELAYIAFKKKLIRLKDGDKQVLDALLYATKFKGASISDQEIEQIKRL